jgi:hypothetical protein
MPIYTDDLIEQREHQLINVDPVPPGQQVDSARTAYDNTPIGPIPFAYDVRAVFDSRPVNGYDFNIVVSTSGELVNPITISFTVPNGYVAVLKRVISFIESPIPASALRSDVLLTLLLNQGVVPNNANIPVGIEQDDLVRCFVIADQGSVLSARLVVSAAILALTPTYTIQFYGNLLQKTNIPTPFEVANPTHKVTGQPNLISAPTPISAAPIVTAPTPTLPRTAQVPPFKVGWSYNLDQRPRVYYPVAEIGRTKRVLTTAEQFTYREFLDATRPRN